MCLGEYATVVEVLDTPHAIVRFDNGSTRSISLAVLIAEGTRVERGDVVAVSIGMALHRVDDPIGDPTEHTPAEHMEVSG